MENTDNIYNYLINKLHDTKPELGDAKTLTDNIMNALNETSVNYTKRIIQWARPLLTAAALFLFGLFIFQQLDKPDELQVSSFIYHEKVDQKTIASNCLAEVEQYGNKNRTLFRIYSCYIKQTELANNKSKLILMEHFSKYRIKSSI